MALDEKQIVGLEPLGEDKKEEEPAKVDLDNLVEAPVINDKNEAELSSVIEKSQVMEQEEETTRLVFIFVKFWLFKV